jgi:predicted RND superfamily exporter protein
MHSIGFGLERVAWPALKWPRAAGAVFCLLLAVAAYGVTRLAFDEDLRNTFASNSAEYSLYTSATAEFVDPENETILLVEGERLGEPDVFQRLQDLQFELQLTEGVGSVYSLFALRAAPRANGDMPLLVRDAVAGLSPALAEEIRAHPVLGEKLLSADGKAMVFVVTPAEEKAPLAFARELNPRIEALTASLLDGTGLAASVTGYPAIRISIVDLLKRDQIVLNAVGALIGFVISLFAFRSFVGAVVTATPAIVAGLTVLGGMGLFGANVTVMSNVIPALVMILGYADGMHLSHAWRKHRDLGKSPIEAEWAAQKEVAPACILTAITVAVAFASLAITDISLVRGFAINGALAMLVGGPMVLVGHAFGAMLLGRWWRAGGTNLDLLERAEEPCARLARWVVARARAIALAVFGLFLVFGALYWAVPPEHSVREHLPWGNPANAALGRYDANFGGAFPVQIVVPRGGTAATSAEGLALIGRVHEAAAAVDGVSTPLSLWSLYRWLGGPDDPAALGELERLVEQMPAETRARFIGERTGSALVTVSVTEAQSHVMETRFSAVEEAVAAAGAEGAKITGVTVVTNREASTMIGNLNWSLVTAVFFDVLIIMVAFRNVPIGIVSVLPNTFPLAATGALLFITGWGMQFTTVIALTVAFGIAIDDTIHYLNRLLILHDRKRPLDWRIVGTSREIGPVLIGTTIIILAGLSTTFFSGLPTVTLFGIIAGITLVVAAAGDLVVLPAIVASFARPWFEPRPVIVRTEEDEITA